MSKRKRARKAKKTTRRGNAMLNAIRWGSGEILMAVLKGVATTLGHLAVRGVFGLPLG